MLRLLIPFVLFFVPRLAVAQPTKVRSHPPLRVAPKPAKRAMDSGPAKFVDARRGNDKANGSRTTPWKSIGHALENLSAGDTLYIRGGTYRERVRIALKGAAKKPITIRAYPGEAVVLDGGYAEFFDAPAQAWEPVAGGAKGEYRSRKTYRNLRNIYGWFGDSMIGLNSYYHAKDLRATNETITWPKGADPKTTDIRPLYCGPGLWYDATTGRIHCRLAHTHLPKPVPNYNGETDPRKLPLVVSSFRSKPLMIDGATHVRIQDLTIRGGGYDTVEIDHGTHITLDNLTLWCSSYGLRASRTRHLKILNCGFYGSCPPWHFRGDTSKRAYPGRPFRDITRLNTHSHLVIGAGREYSVFAHPVNENWEIAYCEFTDAHDGPYLGGVSMKFHHNLIEDTQDDGVYLSQMYPRHLYWRSGAKIEIYQNVFRRCLTALAFGGPEDTRDQLFIYRNIVDLRSPVWTGRPRGNRPKPAFSYGKLMGDHGSPPWPAMNIYHNTFVMRGPARTGGMTSLTHSKPEHPRKAFNNVFLHLARLPGYGLPDADRGVIADGNIYWSPAAVGKKPAAFFGRFRRSRQFTASKAKYPLGTSTNSQLADPKFRSVPEDPAKTSDYRPQPGSPLINAGVSIPKEWPDVANIKDPGKPDVGALPKGTTMFPVGRQPVKR